MLRAKVQIALLCKLEDSGEGRTQIHRCTLESPLIERIWIRGRGHIGTNNGHTLGNSSDVSWSSILVGDRLEVNIKVYLWRLSEPSTHARNMSRVQISQERCKSELRVFVRSEPPGWRAFWWGLFTRKDRNAEARSSRLDQPTVVGERANLRIWALRRGESRRGIKTRAGVARTNVRFGDRGANVGGRRSICPPHQTSGTGHE